MQPSKIISVLMVGLLLAGCSSLNPFGGGGSKKKEEERAERYDDKPLIRSTKAIPADHENARHTDEALKGE